MKATKIFKPLLLSVAFCLIGHTGYGQVNSWKEGHGLSAPTSIGENGKYMDTQVVYLKPLKLANDSRVTRGRRVTDFLDTQVVYIKQSTFGQGSGNGLVRLGTSGEKGNGYLPENKLMSLSNGKGGKLVSPGIFGGDAAGI